MRKGVKASPSSLLIAKQVNVLLYIYLFVKKEFQFFYNFRNIMILMLKNQF